MDVSRRNRPGRLRCRVGAGMTVVAPVLEVGHAAVGGRCDRGAGPVVRRTAAHHMAVDTQVRGVRDRTAIGVDPSAQSHVIRRAYGRTVDQ